MIINIKPDGTVTGLYNELIHAMGLGEADIFRASTVHFDKKMQGFIVTVIGYGDKINEPFGPFDSYEAAVRFEIDLLTERLREDPDLVRIPGAA